MLNKDEVVKLADDAELTYCGGKSGFFEDADLTEYLMAFASAIWEKAVLTEREA